jgi:hypothetical protein
MVSAAVALFRYPLTLNDRKIQLTTSYGHTKQEVHFKVEFFSFAYWKAIESRKKIF